MAQPKFKNAASSVKRADAAVTTTDEGIFEAVVALWTVDREGDVIDPAAFDETIAAWQRSGKNIPLHWDHKADGPQEIIGYVDPKSLKAIPELGLFARGRVDIAKSEKAREAWRLMRDNSVGFSFGYLIDDSAPRVGGGLDLKKLDVFEFSVTPAPAHADTKILALKSMARKSAAELRREADALVASMALDGVDMNEPTVPTERYREAVARGAELQKAVAELSRQRDDARALASAAGADEQLLRGTAAALAALEEVDVSKLREADAAKLKAALDEKATLEGRLTTLSDQLRRAQVAAATDPDDLLRRGAAAMAGLGDTNGAGDEALRRALAEKAVLEGRVATLSDQLRRAEMRAVDPDDLLRRGVDALSDVDLSGLRAEDQKKLKAAMGQKAALEGQVATLSDQLRRAEARAVDPDELLRRGVDALSDVDLSGLRAADAERLKRAIGEKEALEARNAILAEQLRRAEVFAAADLDEQLRRGSAAAIEALKGIDLTKMRDEDAGRLRAMAEANGALEAQVASLADRLRRAEARVEAPDDQLRRGTVAALDALAGLGPKGAADDAEWRKHLDEAKAQATELEGRVAERDAEIARLKSAAAVADPDAQRGRASMAAMIAALGDTDPTKLPTPTDPDLQKALDVNRHLVDQLRDLSERVQTLGELVSTGDPEAQRKRAEQVALATAVGADPTTLPAATPPDDRPGRVFEALYADDVKGFLEGEVKAVWTTAYVNDLPDSAFLYVESGGSKDDEGKTTPRSLRHFPYKDASGAVDPPHLRNALSRIPQSSLPQAVKDRLTATAQRILAAQKSAARRPATSLDEPDDPDPLRTRADSVAVEVATDGLRPQKSAPISPATPRPEPQIPLPELQRRMRDEMLSVITSAEE